MTPLMLVFCFTCLCSETMAQTVAQKPSSAVHQESGFLSADVGGEITLRCFNEGKTAYEFHWYKQTMGQKPMLISSFYGYVEIEPFQGEFKNNPRFTLNANKSQNHLKITDLHFSDTATYLCVSKKSKIMEFIEGIFLSVKGSGLNFEFLVDQSGSETIQPGGSVTLSCTVHTGTCDGEQSVYWFKNSEDSQPGLIYIHGDENDQCERKPSQQSCEFILPMQSLNHSHVGIYYCAVASCGHILFGNRTTLSFKDEENSPVLLYVLSGALTFTVILVVLLSVMLCVIIKRNGCRNEDSCTGFPASSATNQQTDHNQENIHYSSVREHRRNRARRQKKNPEAECVYSGIKQ